ncbi:hypothetical protein CGCSCA4_v008585 [Colletotrichum siamense]|uniref:Uncharacterized protein n=1 Tax=Colletotrichum siamense TaxID=690259 RepID=A0A9P5EQN7_COLSI|nr:hypothetical protein CGCSCA4_v008585 [Colletotrichum siamense]KAF4858004.1 hypothetical protein CGCSCA2_v007739 [Colletotrichum siamense]
MDSVFPFRYTTYGAGFNAAHSPGFPISDQKGGLMSCLAPHRRLRVELDRKEAAKIKSDRPFIVQWFMPINRWGNTLEAVIEYNFMKLAHPSRLLKMSVFAVSRGTKDHPQTDVVIVAQFETEEERPNHSQLRSQVYPEILRLLSSPEVERPEIGCYVEYCKDPRRMENPLGILAPEEAKLDTISTPKILTSSSSSNNSRPSSPARASLNSDGPQPPEKEDEKAKQEVDPVFEFFDMDAYDASIRAGSPSNKS